MNYVVLGPFDVTGDKLMVTDPCYSRSRGGVVNNVVPGAWFGTACYSDEGTWGKRVCQVVAQCFGGSGVAHLAGRWIRESFGVGVDSGQAGIFDEARYPMGECGEYDDTGTFYGRACKATLNGGVIAEGVVTCSGYGDGTYTCETLRDSSDRVLAVRITFISDEDDEEDDWLRR